MRRLRIVIAMAAVAMVMAACGANAEIATEPVQTEHATTVEKLQITEEMLLLSQHSLEIESHCVRWECESGCDKHCDERCVIHIPEWVGGYVTCPSGKLWCVGVASSDEREKLQDLAPEDGFWIEVDPTTLFEVAGIKYVSGVDGKQDPDPMMWSDVPATTFEMRHWGAAMPNNMNGMGLVYLINPDSIQELDWEEIVELSYDEGPPEEFWLVLPYFIVQADCDW